MFNTLNLKPKTTISFNSFNAKSKKDEDGKIDIIVLNGTEYKTGTTGTDAALSAVTFNPTNYRIAITDVPTDETRYIYRQYASVNIAGYKRIWIDWTGTSNDTGTTTFSIGTSTLPGGTVASIVRTSTFTQTLESLNIYSLDSSVNYFVGVILYTQTPSNSSNSRTANIYNMYLEG
jgi:hypothetical protein